MEKAQQVQVVGQLTLMLPNSSQETLFEQAPLAYLTNNQQALVFYYVLRVCGVKPRDTVALTTVAKCMHLLLGKHLPKIDRSSLYKSLLAVPDLNNPKALSRDFACIQPLFAQVGLDDALQLMEYDLALASR